jgi:predicted nucleic acid-binding protein
MIIVDTGFWVALLDQKDRHHTAAKHALQVYNEPLITTWPVLTETSYLLLRNQGSSAASNLLNSFGRGLFSVFDLQPSHGERIGQLMQQYANLPMDLADASLVLLAEHLGHGRILSVDRRDFAIYRWNLNQPFQNLLA